MQERKKKKMRNSSKISKSQYNLPFLLMIKLKKKEKKKRKKNRK